MTVHSQVAMGTMISKQKKIPQQMNSGFTSEVVHRKHSRRKSRKRSKLPMEKSTSMKTIAEIHKPPRLKSKCHRKSKLSSKSLNMSLSSLDSGFPATEALAPINLDLPTVYTHVQNANVRLEETLKKSQKDVRDTTAKLTRVLKENSGLKEDSLMLKNLVYRLNIELEKFQGSFDQESFSKMKYALPNYYNKNFLKPVLPLLKAYSGVIEEKEQLIQQLDGNLQQMAINLQQLVKENETLYKELELKLDGPGESLDSPRLLKRELKVVKDERDLYRSQAKIAEEKLQEVQQIYSNRVVLAQKESALSASQLQELQTDFSNLKGQNQVLKQEFERLKIEESAKVPVVVHTSAINECKRLFQELKNEYELEKQKLANKIKELKITLHDSDLTLKEFDSRIQQLQRERLELEQGNVDLAVENDNLRQEMGKIGDRAVMNGSKDDFNLTEKKLRDANKRISLLENKLQSTRKQLNKSMAFAEDIVREQEALLTQLHEKQRENSRMVSHFGSLKSQLQSVEREAKGDLDSIEDKIRKLEEEKQELLNEVLHLKKLLSEKYNRPQSDASVSP